MDFRVGIGYDVHALADGLRLVLCGVEVEHTKGCVAHSDGDVAIHAICDALLGTLALGDIGKLFPDSDERYKGIDSRKLLKHVVELIRSKGYEISNIDCTIAMQRPKLRPHIDLMRERLAETIGIEIDHISIKATTTEHLGFEGREEGVSATAVALVIKQ
jgi:2-C-methyl-D-erythritol 2,4-cyclodiphosphate synthase